MKLVGNTKTFTLLRQFFGAKAPTDDRLLEVGEGETLPLGAHTLHFMLAPMVHWPEVMVAYEETEKILFSADAFGRFGALSRTAAAPWAPQARRYYYNIVGKYGAQVQALLKKAAALEIETICPLHGPVLTRPCGSTICGHAGKVKHPRRSCSPTPPFTATPPARRSCSSKSWKRKARGSRSAT